MYKKLSNAILLEEIKAIQEEEQRKSLVEEFYSGAKKQSVQEKRGSVLYQSLREALIEDGDIFDQQPSFLKSKNNTLGNNQSAPVIQEV